MNIENIITKLIEHTGKLDELGASLGTVWEELQEIPSEITAFKEGTRAHVSDLRTKWENLIADMPPSNDLTEFNEQLRDLESYLDD